MNRGYRNNQSTNSNSPQTTSSNSSGSNSSPSGTSKKTRTGKFGGLRKIGAMGFLIALALIVAGTIFAMIFVDNNNPEANSVDKNKYQAVFLNGGQVYFGKVTDLNSKYTRLNDIFYLRVNQQVQPDQQTTSSNDVSLVKLGCELHGPQDQMVINRDQVIFWENIKDDGQVVKAINEYKKQYPNGEQCQQQSGDNNSSSNNNSGANSTTNNTNTGNNSTGNTNTGNQTQTPNANN